MWATDTPWFDVALVMSIFAIGSILFGHFEEHKPKGRRVLKVAVVLGVFVGLSRTVGREWALLVLMVPIAGAAVVHLWWLPKNGVNGWTGEPKDRYYALIGHRPPQDGRKKIEA